MDDSTTTHSASRAARQHSDIRVIVTTTRLALREADDHGQNRARILTRALELLALLEQKVLLDGKDPIVLAAIGTARGELSARMKGNGHTRDRQS